VSPNLSEKIKDENFRNMGTKFQIVGKEKITSYTELSDSHKGEGSTLEEIHKIAEAS